MLTLTEALEIATDAARQLPSERIDITDAVGRVLAEDVISDIDMPPFDRSAMDGFACRRADLAKDLTVIEVIPAGTPPERAVGPGQCSKIMTGSMVPLGADCVVMKEHVEIRSDNCIRFVGSQTTDNIRRRGEDVKAGDIVLKKGTLLRTQHIGILASFGKTTPLVSRKPRVAVIATGNELLDPTSRPGDSQIRDSNSLQIAAQIERMGATAVKCGIVNDTVKSIDLVFNRALEGNDVIVISGGVSVGDFDFVPQVFMQNGVELLFERIAIKPGRPTVFGVSRKAYCFGLPGNPVSTFVLFELMIKPFLYKLMGYRYKARDITIALDKPVGSKKAARESWVPVLITDRGTAKPVEYHGSAHINALCDADGLMRIDAGTAEIKQGSPVTVRLI